jgi:flagellar protein export ATPase FliI
VEIVTRLPNLERFRERFDKLNLFEVLGRVNQVVGLVVESTGPAARIGDLCYIEPHGSHSKVIEAEVVGFRGEKVLMMPLGEITGIRAGCLVRGTGECIRVPVGEGLLGRVLDGLGHPMDGLGDIDYETTYPIQASPPNALERRRIQDIFRTGVRAIDGLLTMGVGQRVGIFAGSGVGKSTLLGMIARKGQADVNVVALVGERGREVREFLELDLGEEGMERSVVVCATSDAPALVRLKAAFTATAIAEYFRDQGLNVMFMMDSVTRFAMAQREVGLAIGEPPTTRGYTPSVFAMMPKLMERAGCGSKGAITALYTVLIEGDDTNEPVADIARSVLDGHIFLSRKLSSRGHYPPIDVLQSLSRLMPLIVDSEQMRCANTLREMLAAYYDIEDLVSIGAYKQGTKPLADRVLDRWDKVQVFLRQDKNETSTYEETVKALEELTHV